MFCGEGNVDSCQSGGNYRCQSKPKPHRNLASFVVDYAIADKAKWVTREENKRGVQDSNSCTGAPPRKMRQPNPVKLENTRKITKTPNGRRRRRKRRILSGANWLGKSN